MSKYDCWELNSSEFESVEIDNPIVSNLPENNKILCIEQDGLPIDVSKISADNEDENTP